MALINDAHAFAVDQLLGSATQHEAWHPKKVVKLPELPIEWVVLSPLRTRQGVSDFNRERVGGLIP